MQHIFSRSSVKDKDCYVADYTHYNNEKGVIISDEPFSDVEYFHLIVAPAEGLPYLAVNIEEYDSFKREYKIVRQCLFRKRSRRINLVGRYSWN